MCSNRNLKVVLHPVISSIQKIAVYETKAKIFIVGSNNKQTSFRILKLDRTEPKELVVVDDGAEYTKYQIQNFVSKIDTNRIRGTGAKCVSAFGILGFVRFLEGYYLILVTKRMRVAAIGLHFIYKIEQTTMMYIPNESARIPHPDEARYLKMFQTVDLSSNFYFSYSYDITHTMQVNMALPVNLHCFKPSPTDQPPPTNKEGEREVSSSAPSTERDADQQSTEQRDNVSKSAEDRKDARPPPMMKIVDYAVRSEPNRRFVWNLHLLSEVEGKLHPDWLLHMIHGFIAQSSVSIFGRSIYVTLIARRSSKYAGTRFLKRGANFTGDVANEVETEQIVEDMGVSSVDTPRLCSFVQMRGSIPGHWSQVVTKIVPKPTIAFDLSDPFAETAGRHFNHLLERYGSPIIILNLVKQREKKKHESTLSEQFSADIKYLNQFLPPQHSIQYVTFDMARKNKGKMANVMGRLGKIALSAIGKTGIFCTFPENLQKGVIRVNCVDCLDRTNTAQFALGKCALGFQLSALGLLSSGELDFDCDCTRLLEVLYEDHGDTLALQYGGSQLVHRIKTYRKTAPWTSQANDITQTLSRYYSNTFSDAEKQHAINLFLGLYVPSENVLPIWELTTDYYLHHSSAMQLDPPRPTKPQTQWWDRSLIECLPVSWMYRQKTAAGVTPVGDREAEWADAYSDFYRPHEFTPLVELHSYTVTHSVRDFMPHCVTDFSPFTVRVQPGRRRDDSGALKNPSLTGHSSTSSTTSSASSSQESDEEDAEIRCSDSRQSSPAKQSSTSNSYVSFQSLFPSMRATYGTDLKTPSSQDIQLYKHYVVTERLATRRHSSTAVSNSTNSITLKPLSNFGEESSFEVTPPKVKQESLKMYEAYVAKRYSLNDCITTRTAEKYARYVNNQLYLFPSVGWNG